MRPVPRRRTDVLALALCVAPLLSCVRWEWREVPAPPAAMRVMRGPVRVTLNDTRVLEMRNVVIATDSLFGTTTDLLAVRTAVSLHSVTAIQESRRDLLRTVVLIGVIVLFATVTGLAG